jgi:prophage antirepressor-like protein
MNNGLMSFMDERFGEVRMVDIYGKPYAVASDVAKALGYAKPNNAINTHCRSTLKQGIATKQGNMSEMVLIPQGDIVRLIVKCPLDGADMFESWIFDKVIPEVMNTGSYIAPTKQAEKIAVSKVMANADMEMLELVQSMVVNQIQLKKDLQLAEEQNKLLQIEVSHKEDVIIGLVEDIDLATKRQRLNQIMKYGFTTGKNQADKWSLLYNEFERKYHINLKIRMGRDNKDMKPKFKNKLDYIDRGMNMIPQTYELACKIFCNDVEKLKSEWFDTVGGK